MPVVLRIDGKRFFFYSNESQEPPHIHVQQAEKEAKFWLEPVLMAFNHGYNGPELRRIERLVIEHKDTLLEAWNAYFTN